jgi:hypothetical protein
VVSLLTGEYLAGSRSEHAYVRAFGRTWGCSLLDFTRALTCQACVFDGRSDSRYTGATLNRRATSKRGK